MNGTPPSSIIGSTNSMTNTSPTTILIEKILKTVLTSGAALTLLRFVTLAIQQHLSTHKSSKKKSSVGNNKIQKNIENFWISLLQLIAMDRSKCCSHCKHCNREYEDGNDTPDEYYKTAYNPDSDDASNKINNSKRPIENSDSEDEMVEYKGSCHCQSIQFSLKAKKNLIAYDCPGKIRYAFLPTNTNDFTITSSTSTDNEELLSIYYVSSTPSDTKKATVAAHVFCKICGVFILRAPDKQCNSIDVNIHCLDGDNLKNNDKTKVIHWNNGFSSGIPILSNSSSTHDSPATPLTTRSSSASTTNTYHNQSPRLVSSPGPSYAYKTTTPIASRKDRLPQAHDHESCASSIGSNNTLLSTNNHFIHTNNTMLPSPSHDNRMMNSSKHIHNRHHWLLNNGANMSHPKSFLQSSSSLGSNNSNNTNTTATLSSNSITINQYNINRNNNTSSLLDTTQQMKYYMKRYLETNKRKE